MLVDVDQIGSSTKLFEGVYLSHWFNFELDFRGRQVYELDFPKLTDDYSFDCYGVCDTPEQLLELLPEVVKGGDRKFVISMVRLDKKDESPEGGWRWHKWGAYIGTQEPQCEYLYDEPVIETVYTFHIYEVK